MCADMSQPHESLVAWQRADDLAIRIYRVTRERFPREERFGLSAQLRRAPPTAVANIVEGYADVSSKWRLRYLRIAIGSLAEGGYALHLAYRLAYLSDLDYETLRKEVSRTAGPLHGLLKSERKAALAAGGD
jgi:four helix bundle protein